MNAPVPPTVVLEAQHLARHYSLKRGMFGEPATVRALVD